MGDRLSGKVAVITGAASGIGAASAERFVAEGTRVVVADMQDALGEAVADRLGDSAVYVHCDVTEENQVAAAVDLAVTTWGRLDVMFNNAGIVGAVGPIVDTSADAWHKTIDVLLNSVFYGTKHAARMMIPQRSGSIIATTSVAGMIGGLGPHGYTAAKTAVVGFTKSVASELNQYTIRVNAIAPGTIPTALTAQALGGGSDDLCSNRRTFPSDQRHGHRQRSRWTSPTPRCISPATRQAGERPHAGRRRRTKCQRRIDPVCQCTTGDGRRTENS